MHTKAYKYILLALLNALLLPSVFAQQHSVTELKPVFEKLKGLKAYSFENHTKASYSNGQKQEATTKVYMDKGNKCLSYVNEGESVLLNKTWAYKASHINKTAQVFKLDAYNKRNKGVLPELQSLFKYDLSAAFVDSVLLTHGKMLSSDKKGTKVTCTLAVVGLPYIKQVIIVYDDGTLLPESIYMRTESPPDGSGRKTVTETVCDNYKTTVPASVFDEHQFFAIVKGKPVLTQYKNYKVYSVL
jgi:outer membrane lipoprotein-sorting protein